MGLEQMSRWGKPTKNKRRVDPRYFLQEQEELGFSDTSLEAEDPDLRKSLPSQDVQYGTSPAFGTGEDTIQDYDSPDAFNPLTLGMDSATWSPQTGVVSGLEQAGAGAADAALGHAAPGAPEFIQRQYSKFGGQGKLSKPGSTRIPGLGTAAAKKLGLIGTTLGAAEVIGHAAQGRPGDAVQAAAGTGGGIAGGMAGAALGAKLGALGGPAAPFTVPAGAFLGGVAGSVGGDKVMRDTSETAKNVYNKYGFVDTWKRGGEELIDLFREGKERPLMAEQQYKRFQKLAGIRNDKPKALLSEVFDPLGMMAGIGFALVLFELQSQGFGYGPASAGPTGPLSAIGNMVGSAIEKLKAAAQNKAQQGDPTLESILSQAEDTGKNLAARFDDEQIAQIQAKLSDDEQLATMLTQLGEAPPEAYEQALSQIEQYIRTKLQ